MILKKGNKLYSILTGKCPKCHHELMYKNSNAYQLSQTLEMHERCGHCQTKYKIEPSFFYGSMYVSYGVGIAFSVAAFLLTFILFETSLVHFIYCHCCYTHWVYAHYHATLSKYLDQPFYELRCRN